ncbi:hypothetical protein JQ604_33005 [Bradyrhizobium jicamae]|uniref:Wzz/FepE/Etk N-terminal domain-containing protein n=1 Tax=Bradyrhizobium jicamae TaxID=280332 RepID=UPI001BA86A65|nr:Wzz/FepE/Etk N-terminal domain-containing protein [Bradyrhizobium jicamae]MBR0757027.1 hypothetical protein [Bradyrhizobium jicamae]
MNEPQVFVSNEQYLSGLLTTLLQALRPRKLLLILLPITATLLAYGVSRLLPPVFEAQASIRIGRIDGAEQISLQTASVRVNTVSFKQRVLRAMEMPNYEENRQAQLIFWTLSARPETSDTIAVSVQASSVEQVRQVFDTIVQLLNADQKWVTEPLIADINEQIVGLDTTIAELTRARDSLTALGKSMAEVQSHDAASAAFRSVWLFDLLARNEQRLDAAKNQRHDLATRLGSWRTYQTATVDAAFILPKQIAPRPFRTAILIGGLTFLACVLFAVWRSPTRRIRQVPV